MPMQENDIPLNEDKEVLEASTIRMNNINDRINTQVVELQKLNKDSTTSGYLATYEIKQGGQRIGLIDIPKDFLVKSATLETCSKTGTPTGMTKGDKYIDFIINVKAGSATSEHVYVKVTDLVDVYTADNSTLQVSNNQFSIKNGGVGLNKLASGVYETGYSGTSGSKLVPTNDSRLSDARTPKSHTHVSGDIGITQALPANSDLNEITTQGVYTCTLSNSETLANKPFIGESTCIIENKNFSSASFMQTVYTLDSYTMVAYVRTYKSNKWGSWRYLAGTGSNMIPAKITVEGQEVNNDLNNYRQEGLYTCGSTNSATVDNKPFSDKRAFYLRVIDYRVVNYLIQILFPITNNKNNNKIYYRIMFGDGIWYPNNGWHIIATIDDIPTKLSELTNDLNNTIENKNIKDNTIELDKLNSTNVIDNTNGGTSGSGKLITSGAVYSGLSGKVNTSDSRLSDARTPKSHTDSNGNYGKATTGVYGHTILVDNLTTNASDKALTAKQGKVLNDDKLSKSDEVGGTNLITRTQAFTFQSKGTLTGEYYKTCAIRRFNNIEGTTNLNCYGTIQAGEFTHGDTFTLSFWAKGTGKIGTYFSGTESNFIKNKVINRTNGAESVTGNYDDGICKFPLSNDWKRYFVTWELNPTSDVNNDASITKQVVLRTYTGGDSYVAGVMLERGKIAHDWTASPNDIPTVENSLSSDSTTNALSAAKGKELNTTLSNHNHDSTYIKTGTGTVTSTNIADNAITSDKIADGSITYKDQQNGGGYGETLATAGYLKLLKITLTKGYQDYPITFDIFQRAKTQSTKCYLLFHNYALASENVKYFKTTGENREVYIHKIDNEYSWEVFVQKPASATIELKNLNTLNVVNGIQFTMLNTLMDELPSEYITSDHIGLTKNDVDSSLSSSSTNPIQNKVINSALSGKISKTSGNTNLLLADGTNTSQINFVTTDKIDAKAVTTAKIDDGAITTTQLATDVTKKSFMDAIVIGQTANADNIDNLNTTASQGKYYCPAGMFANLAGTLPWEWGNGHMLLLVYSSPDNKIIQEAYQIKDYNNNKIPKRFWRMYTNFPTTVKWSDWQEVYTDKTIPSASTSQKGIVQLGTGSSNAATGNHNHNDTYATLSHSHTASDLPTASTNAKGIVQLINNLTTNASDKALTAAQGKELATNKQDKLTTTNDNTNNGNFKVYKYGNVVTVYFDGWIPNVSKDNQEHSTNVQLSSGYRPLKNVYISDVTLGYVIRVATDGIVYCNCGSNVNIINATQTWVVE